MKMENMPCPCGSNRVFSQCCGQSKATVKSLRMAFELLRIANEDSNDNIKYWDSNNKEIKDLISTYLNGRALKEVAVLGAGNCGDIPMELLADHFQSIHLYDLDWIALKTTMSLLPTSIKKKTKIKILDLTGLFHTAIPRLYELIETSNLDLAVDYMTSLKSKSPKIPIINKKYDLVLSLNTVSQLFTPFIQLTVAAFRTVGVIKQSPFIEPFLNEAAQFHDSSIVQQHLRFIKSITKNNGLVIVSSDKYECGKSFWDNNPNPKIKAPEEMLNSDNQNELHPITGSSISNYIDEYFTNVKRSQWIWNYNSERYYLVEAFTAQR